MIAQTSVRYDELGHELAALDIDLDQSLINAYVPLLRILDTTEDQAAFDAAEREVLALNRRTMKRYTLSDMHRHQAAARAIIAAETPAPPAEIAQTVSPMLAKAIEKNQTREAAKRQRNSREAMIARAEAAWDAEDAATAFEQGIMTTSATTTLTDLRNTATISMDEARALARQIIDETELSLVVSPEARPAMIARYAAVEAARQWLANNPTPADSYANLPSVGGGAHTAAELNRATSQKRDNQRAERNAAREAYDAHATANAQEIADMFTDLGFVITEEREFGSTPITIWSNDQATIKQTPYTLKVYNGTPKRLGKRADGEVVRRIAHGWRQRGEATGYAAGIVAALLPLIETPDPYMQALDAMEQRYPAGDYRNDYPEDDNLLPPVRDCQRCGRQLTISGICQWCDMEQGEHPPTPEMTAWGNAPWYSASLAKTYPAISGGSQEADTLTPRDDDYCVISGCEQPAVAFIPGNGRDLVAVCDAHRGCYDLVPEPYESGVFGGAHPGDDDLPSIYDHDETARDDRCQQLNDQAWAKLDAKPKAYNAPFHARRKWNAIDIESAEELADKLTNYSWCLCNAFRIGGYLFLNDATSEDGAHEFAVVRESDMKQVETITFGWMKQDKALTYIKQALAGEMREAFGYVNPKHVTINNTEHRCHLCA